MDDMTRCELLKTISEYQFVAVELNLYLDTHPGDAAARSISGNSLICKNFVRIVK